MEVTDFLRCRYIDKNFAIKLLRVIMMRIRSTETRRYYIDVRSIELEDLEGRLILYKRLDIRFFFIIKY